ncbi:hypothetical protein HMPREF1870_02908 [Bacteroidales bacterium KA00344]|nr:hypothetical protein HMPREF1870_02908 [Bacteroidales bacterium KA00344]
MYYYQIFIENLSASFKSWRETGTVWPHFEEEAQFFLFFLYKHLQMLRLFRKIFPTVRNSRKFGIFVVC